MVFFNYSTMQMAAKVVYYGPGLCGKTTNLQWIFDHTSTDTRGEMVSLATETDRTLFFDLLPIDVGSIAGFNTRIQLYTVPGQVFYNTTRKLVLKGVDGVVFVADSQRPMVQANVDSFNNLEENLAEMGLSLETIPVVLQYNKRDLDDILTVDELNETLNRNDWPAIEAAAINGMGVFETLKMVSKMTLLALKKRLTKGRAESPTATTAQRAPAAVARPAPVPKSPPPRPAPKPPPALFHKPPERELVAAPEPVPAPQPIPALEPVAAAEPVPAPQPIPALEPVAAPEPVPAPQPVPAPEPRLTPEPEPTFEPLSVTEPSAVPEPLPAPEAVAAPEPVPAPQPVPAPEPFEAPEPVLAEPAGPEPVPAFEPLPAFEPVAVPEPTPVAAPRPTPSPAPPPPRPSGPFPAAPPPKAPPASFEPGAVPSPAAPSVPPPKPLPSPPPAPERPAVAPVAAAPAAPAPPAAGLAPPPSPTAMAAEAVAEQRLTGPRPILSPPAKRPRKPRLGGIDALAELEKLRRQALPPKRRKRVAGPGQGASEIRREIALTVGQADLRRVRRCALTLQLEDADQRPLDHARAVQVELENAEAPEQLLLHLTIALNSEKQAGH